MVTKSLIASCIENWDVSRVTSMQDLFFLDPYSKSMKPKFGCWISPTLHDGFICGPADEHFDRTLENFRSFNQPLNNWNVSNVTNMSGMFRHATDLCLCYRITIEAYVRVEHHDDAGDLVRQAVKNETLPTQPCKTSINLDDTNGDGL